MPGGSHTLTLWTRLLYVHNNRLSYTKNVQSTFEHILRSQILCSLLKRSYGSRSSHFKQIIEGSVLKGHKSTSRSLKWRKSAGLASSRKLLHTKNTLSGAAAESVTVVQVPVPEYQINGNQQKIAIGDEILFKGLESEFPCMTKRQTSGPEPAYNNTVSGYQTFNYDQKFYLRHREGVLPGFTLAYETWGTLNEEKKQCCIFVHGVVCKFTC